MQTKTIRVYQEHLNIQQEVFLKEKLECFQCAQQQQLNSNPFCLRLWDRIFL